MFGFVKIKTMGSCLTRAAVVVLTLLLTATSAALARQPTANDWAGKAVVPKVR